MSSPAFGRGHRSEVTQRYARNRFTPVGVTGLGHSTCLKNIGRVGIRPEMSTGGRGPAAGAHFGSDSHTTYVFQARAVTKAGYSDWSESVTRVSLCNLTPRTSPERGSG